MHAKRQCDRQCQGSGELVLLLHESLSLSMHRQSPHYQIHNNLHRICHICTQLGLARCMQYTVQLQCSCNTQCSCSTQYTCRITAAVHSTAGVQLQHSCNTGPSSGAVSTQAVHAPLHSQHQTLPNFLIGGQDVVERCFLPGTKNAVLCCVCSPQELPCLNLQMLTATALPSSSSHSDTQTYASHLCVAYT